MSKRNKKKRIVKQIVEQKKPKKAIKYKGNKILEVFFNNYKALFFIPIVILLISMGTIAYKISTTGEFVNKGISLKGGTTFTITDSSIDTLDLENYLNQNDGGHEFTSRKLTEGSKQIGITLESDVTKVKDIDFVVSLLKDKYSLEKNDYTIETMGSSLGESFFKQTFRALILAFIFMALVVFLYFKTFAPSIAVVLAAFSDMVVTLAVINILGINLSTAGIAAFLMLIGYSVDTDILLTTRVLKAKEGTLFSNMIRAMKTGLTMTFTTIIAVTVALIVSQSDVLKQIMTILLIGLLADLINTWLQNTAIIRWYVERKKNE